jgi:hypothetical protein
MLTPVHVQSLGAVHAGIGQSIVCAKLHKWKITPIHPRLYLVGYTRLCPWLGNKTKPALLGSNKRAGIYQDLKEYIDRVSQDPVLFSHCKIHMSVFIDG